MSPLIILALAAAGLQAPPQAPTIYGIWHNPRGSIHVRIAPCGGELCGTISQASPKAQQDAHDAGIANLIGVQLLRNYTQVSADRWKGRVYVPDMGGTYSSRIVKVSPTALKISGCLIGGWLCKSQLWTKG